MKRFLVLGLASMSVVAGVARADQGRIPIFGPVTITQPGSYVLTRDITVSSGTPINIQASNVTIDLNGHSLTNSPTGGRLITIFSPSTNIRIANGRLVGGVRGIDYNTSTGNAGTSVSIHAVDFEPQGEIAVDISNAISFEMTSSSITNAYTGVLITNPNATTDPRVTARLVGNRFARITHYGVIITGMRSFIATDNEFSDSGLAGIFLVMGSGLITRNVFSAGVALGTIGIDLQGGATGLVLDNTFKGLERGVWAMSNGNRIAGNLIIGPPASAGGSPRGIVLGASGFAADRNLIEINRIDMQSGCAIQFTPDSHDNIYRINTLRGSGGLAVCNNGTGNVDAGGNVY